MGNTMTGITRHPLKHHILPHFSNKCDWLYCNGEWLHWYNQHLCSSQQMLCMWCCKT
jgi:hypothetical protein